MHQLQLHIRQHQGVNVIQLVGSVEPTSFPSLYATLNKLVMDGSPQIVLECSQLNYIGSSELKQLLDFAHHARASGGDIKCVCLCNTVQYVANLVANGDPFDFFDDLPQALATFRTSQTASNR